MTKKRDKEKIEPGYWGLSGRSFHALRGQFMKATAEDAWLEVRLVHKAGEADGLTFLVRDPREQIAAGANVPLDDTWHCPPFCR